ncbi:zinc-dependent alcohol dehydrogenase [Micromonospora fulviviridis]|uniref:Alcohol dehydrogenase catalytic domain-containing protein n=1 Tax=Micromonospora fulviviridis TaxID=47860 RepID=A0ABV2VW24_9ACTN
MMKAYLMYGPGALEFGDKPDPVHGPDEILLQTESVSICSTDVSYFRGHLFPESWPVVPGHEYVGKVVQVGADIRGAVEVGQRVCYWGQTDFGGMAEYRAIRPIFGHQAATETSWYTERNFYDADQAAAVVVPESLSWDAATIIEPLTSVLRSVLMNPPRPGDVCVVLGCGPSAVLATQVLLRYLGVRSVAVVDRNDYRLKIAQNCGAEVGFNTLTEAAALEGFVRDNHDQYADYVFDALPHVAVDGRGKDVRELAMGLLRPGGTYVIYGATGVRQQINTWLILAKGLNVRATPFDVRLFPMTRSAHVANIAVRLLESGLVAAGPVVTNRISFYDPDAVNTAFTNYGKDASMKSCLHLVPVTHSLSALDSQLLGSRG